ncbi:hypothetical protein [Actinophytocola sp.]|uniref:hypothetical protein n=1 Tax=Actinophytocola sp. TaxID=1872138 RepID=UPI002ED21B5B
MSPKVSRPAGDPDETELPPGHVPMGQPARPKPRPRKPVPLAWKVGGYVALLVATVGTIVYLGRPEDPRSSAEGTAELVAKALTEGDISTFQSCMCNVRPLESAAAWIDLRARSVTTVSHVTDEVDNSATATLWSERFPSDLSITLFLYDRNGSWCVFDVA